MPTQDIDPEGVSPDGGHETAPAPTRVKLRKMGVTAGETTVPANREWAAGKREGAAAKRPERTRPRLPAEASMVNAQWERAQKDLERSQAMQQWEAEQTKTKLDQSHAAMLRSRNAEPGEHGSSKRQAQFRVLMGVCALLAVAVGVFGVWKFTRTAPKQTAASVETGISPAGGSAAEEPVDLQPASTAFSQGVGRLSQALSRFPGVDPETILTAINKKASANGTSLCAFAWNEGQPALQFGDKRGGATSVSEKLTQCAEAVERYR